LAKVQSRAISLFIDRKIPDFNGVTKKQLRGIAQLSQNEKIFSDLPDHLLNMGILLVYQQSLPGTKLDGTVFSLSSGNPVIGLSFRYPRLDYFWFTLMHELSHVCLHFKHLETPILDDFEDKDAQRITDIESEANGLAEISFVSGNLWQNFQKYSPSLKDVVDFAKKVQIHPAIVAGRLRKESGDYRRFGKLVNKINVRGMVFDEVQSSRPTS